MLSPQSILVLLLGLSMTLATALQCWFLSWAGNRMEEADVLSVLIGDSRRMFANHFFIKADVYFHSGYYPSIFDQQAASKRLHMEEGTMGAEDEHQDGKGGHDEHDDLPDFLKKPANWIDRFGRNFILTEHIHPEKAADEREMLPWLLASARLDPYQVKTYTIAAFWLRTRLHKPDQAERFLREGLKHNPRNPDILFELGRVLYENRQDSVRARNIWEVALREWERRAAGQKDPDRLLEMQILIHLAHLEEAQGNLGAAIGYLRKLLAVSTNPVVIQQQISELEKKLPAAPKP